ncbi:hypothetical protein VITU102760_13070 [Vibrio tubiashii]|uniref:Transposase n=1 Tax=Vibrio tubiashii ATCC 19109 TaxID=1051646 RepID=A0ABP2LGV7_9VIBR|nr:hypothetical protein VITU9109_23915 [Vibrio tubiashii ATCC 19109]
MFKALVLMLITIMDKRAEKLSNRVVSKIATLIEKLC